MKQYAFLEYTFMFEPSGTWPHLYEFEKDLARFFSEHGFEAEIMKTVEGQSGKRILLIQKKPEVVEKVVEKTKRLYPVKPQIDKFRNQK